MNSVAASGSSSIRAIAPCPDSRDISRDRVAMTLSPSATERAPATTDAATSPIEWPMTASGCTPWERHSWVSASCMPTSTGWIRSMPVTCCPSAMTCCSENPTCSTNAGSISATAAAKAGSSTISWRPIPSHCEPWPE